MAGHSKWANIKHKKAAQDKKRGKIFTKLIKEVTVAVKVGGSDPDSNPRLRAAVQTARAQNVPKDNIERAIKKGEGKDGADYTEVTYEGYGPDGVAIFVEAATDNLQRTVSNVRSYFNKHGGSLGKDGCLQFVFDRKSVFSLPEGELDEEDFTLELIDVGAEDVEFEEGHVRVTGAMEDFGNISKKLEDMGIESVEGALERVPNNTKEIDPDRFTTFMKLVDILEDDDDVQKVYHNLEYNEELANSME